MDTSSFAATADSIGSIGGPTQFIWHDFSINLLDSLRTLLADQTFADVNLVTDDGDGSDHVQQAHRIILAAGSDFFRSVLNKPSVSSSLSPAVIFLKGVRQRDLRNIIQFIYYGNVTVDGDDFASFLKAGEDLRIKGLYANEKQDQNPPNESDLPVLPMLPAPPTVPCIDVVATSSSSAIPRVINVFSTPELNSEGVWNTENDLSDDEGEEIVFKSVVSTPDGPKRVESVPDVSKPDEPKKVESIPEGSKDSLSRELEQFVGDLILPRKNSKSGFQCFSCERLIDKKSMFVKHAYGHMRDSSEGKDLQKRVSDYVRDNTKKNKAGSFLCLLCKTLIKKAFYDAAIHVMRIHLMPRNDQGKKRLASDRQSTESAKQSKEDDDDNEDPADLSACSLDANHGDELPRKRAKIDDDFADEDNLMDDEDCSGKSDVAKEENDELLDGSNRDEGEEGSSIKNDIAEEESEDVVDESNLSMGEEGRGNRSSLAKEMEEKDSTRCNDWRNKKTIDNFSATKSGFMCRICSVVIRGKQHLSEHLRDRHGDEKYRCPKCKKVFDAKSAIKKHIGRCHRDLMGLDLAICLLK